jgi:hypothetical protein
MALRIRSTNQDEAFGPEGVLREFSKRHDPKVFGVLHSDELTVQQKVAILKHWQAKGYIHTGMTDDVAEINGLVQRGTNGLYTSFYVSNSFNRG